MKRRIWQTKRVFFQVGGPIYIWMIEIGRLGISWECKRK